MLKNLNMRTTRRRAIGSCRALGVTIAVSLIGLTSATASASPPAHLDWALSVAINVTPENNTYGSDPTYVTWPGVAGSAVYSNRSKCNTFITRVLRQAYGWSTTDFQNWMGSTSPTAATYFDTILAQNRFTRITTIDSIAAGDVLAAKYLKPTSTATGHTMLATRPAVAMTAIKPIVAGTNQYELQIVDSSSTGHGTTDTRRRADGSYEDGAGVGLIRLYADVNGVIVGYSWSTLSGSTYYDASSRPLAIGRLP